MLNIGSVVPWTHYILRHLQVSGVCDCVFLLHVCLSVCDSCWSWWTMMCWETDLFPTRCLSTSLQRSPALTSWVSHRMISCWFHDFNDFIADSSPIDLRIFWQLPFQFCLINVKWVGRVGHTPSLMEASMAHGGYIWWFGPVEIVSGLVTFLITSIQMIGLGSI